MEYDIHRAIPHRAPFLLVDRIIEVDGTKVVAETTISPDDELWSCVYAGHYPGNPITPGVLTLEMLFQAAGVMIYENLKNSGKGDGVPVVTRIQNVKFRKLVRPEDTVTLKATLVEALQNAYFVKATALVGGKTAVQAEFTLALINVG